MGEKFKPRHKAGKRKGTFHEGDEVFNAKDLPTPEEIERHFKNLNSKRKIQVHGEVHSTPNEVGGTQVYDDSMSKKEGEAPIKSLDDPRITRTVRINEGVPNSEPVSGSERIETVDLKFPNLGINLSGPSNKAKAWENIIVKQVQSALYTLGKPRALVNSFVKKSIIAPLQAGSLPTVQQSLMGLETLLKNKNIVIPVEKIKLSQEKASQEPIVAEDSSLTQEQAFEILTGSLRAPEVVKDTVDFNYPALGISYQGPLTSEVLENEIIPRVKESLIARGLTDNDVVERLINSSLRQLDEKGRHLKGLPLEDVLQNYETGYVRWKEVNLQEEQKNIEQDTVEPTLDPVVNPEILENTEERVAALEARVESLEEKVEGEPTPPPLLRQEEEVLRTSSGPTQDLTKSKNQLSWLTKRTGALINERGVKVKDAIATDPHFKIIRDDIRKLKYRLDLLEKGKLTEKTKAEIKELRHELAEELLILQFREHKNIILRYPTLGINYEGPVTDVEGIQNEVLPHLIETLKKHNLSETEARWFAEKQMASILKMSDPAERTVVLRRYLIDFSNREEERRQNPEVLVTPLAIHETSSTVEMTTGVEEAVAPINVELEIAPPIGEVEHTRAAKIISSDPAEVQQGYNTMSSEEAEAIIARGIEAAIEADQAPKSFTKEEIRRLRKLERKSPKVLANREDQARLYVPIESGEHDADYMLKAMKRTEVVPTEVHPTPTIDTSALEKRLEYYRNNTTEDPKVREHLIANLEMRIERMKNGGPIENSSTGNVVNSNNGETQPKTGWWDQKYRESQKGGYNTMSSEDIEATMARGLEAALEADQGGTNRTGWSDLKSQEGRTGNSGRSEEANAAAFDAVKAALEADQFRTTQTDSSNQKSPDSGAGNPRRSEAEVNASAFDAVKAALEADLDPSIPQVDPAAPRVDFQPQPEPLPEPIPVPPSPEPAPSPQELKAYQERLSIRNVWKEKKASYEEAYKEHVKSKTNLSILQKLGLRKKEEKPENLVTLEREYQEARRIYAQSLSSALRERVNLNGVSLASSEGPSPEKQLLGFRAGLANRFVLQAAHAKLALEKEYVPEGRATRVFDNVQGFMKKRGKYLAFGIAAVSGSVMGMGANTLAYFSPKAGAIIGAATAGGALAGGFVYDKLLLNKLGKKRDTVVNDARRTFSIESIEAFENDYLTRYRSYEKGLRNKKYAVAASGVAAGLVTGGILGNLGSDYSTETPPLNSDVPTPSPNLPSGDSPVEASLGDRPVSEVPIVEPAPEVAPIEKPIPENTPIVKPEGDIVIEKPIPEVAPIEKPEVTVGPEAEPIIESEGIGESSAYEQAQPQAETPYLQGEGEMDPEPDETVPESIGEVLFTFEPNNQVDTVSEALFETWKDQPELLDDNMSRSEFLEGMYTAIAEIERDPILNAELMEQMGISSGDIDKVQVGQTINLNPFFEYLNNK